MPTDEQGAREFDIAAEISSEPGGTWERAGTSSYREELATVQLAIVRMLAQLPEDLPAPQYARTVCGL